MELDFAVACWMVPGRLAACFCGMLGAGLGCCLLDGTRLPAFVECFSSRMLLWVVGLWLLPPNVLPLKFLSVDE